MGQAENVKNDAQQVAEALAAVYDRGPAAVTEAFEAALAERVQIEHVLSRRISVSTP